MRLVGPLLPKVDCMWSLTPIDPCVVSMYRDHALWAYNDWKKKDIEIQPGFRPGSSEFQSDALTNELLELWHWSRG